jgi:hypothetical protein
MNDYYLEKSNRKDKKYMVSYINQETGKINTIRFGAKGMSDFILSKGDEKKKERYIKRHQVNEDWTDLTKAGTWSRYILWGESTLKKSIKEMEKRFGIKIWLIE